MAALGLRCCTRALSSCGEWELVFVAVRGLLITVKANLFVWNGCLYAGLESGGFTVPYLESENGKNTWSGKDTPRPYPRLLIGLPLPWPSDSGEDSSLPTWCKAQPQAKLPSPSQPALFVFGDFSGLEEVMNCFGLKALLLGCSLRGRIIVNKRKGTVSSKDSAPALLHCRVRTLPCATGGTGYPHRAGPRAFHSSLTTNQE